MQKKSFFVYWAVGLLALFALAGVVGVANAALPATGNSTLQGLPAGPSASAPVADDGFDALPADQKGLSYSTLVAMGKVHPVKVVPPAPDNWVNPYSPALNITWGPEKLTGAGSGEPAAGIHPTNFLNALVSGNVSIDNTINGGTSWQTRNPPNSAGYGDVVNAWLEDSPGHALEVALNPSGDGANMTCGQSTDFGVTWANFSTCGTSLSTTYFDDREYIWVDRNASSPFYGRTYVTEALFDSGGSGSFNTVTNRWSSDNGASWNPPSNAPLALVPNNEFALGLNHNEYPSLGISPNGTLGYVWHRGMCCGGPSPINSPNKVMFTRSTDGGVSFPYSTTIVTVPLNQSVPFNSTSPFGQRWSDTPNVAADPTTNGVFYAIWTQYRTPSSPASAAVYLSGTTDNGVTWSTPVIPYNNPNGNIFQGFGWVKVTADHTIHVTYLGGTSSNTQAGQFYVQSTDGGATWTAPFQLNTTAITTFASTTDYEADDVTLSAGPGAILAAWDGNAGHYARIGLFTAGTATPTPTGTLPTATPTNTATFTPSPTLTPCASGVIVNGGFETGTFAPWVILGTQPAPSVSTALPHAGTYSALLGTLTGGEPTGNSSIYQTITVPASGGTLSYWYNPSTSDSITFDWQDAYVTDTSGNILATIMHVCEGTNTWTNVTFDLAPYAGQTIRIEFLVHQDGFGDDTSMYVDDVLLLTACGPTDTPTSTDTPVATDTATSTDTAVATDTPVATDTAVVTATETPTACTISFEDVPVGSTFYPFIECLACRGIINGYPCGGVGEPCNPTNDPYFRPGNDVTRGQFSKIASNSAGFNDPPDNVQQYEDVPVGSTFYDYIWRLTNRGLVNGYPCGGPGEPCGPGNLPYFRPNANVTRGQLSKIDANAAGFNDTPGAQQYEDVLPGSTFYDYIWRLSDRGIINGYPCGGVGEPCGPGNLPYFRPAANATRGQASKIVANTFFPNCTP